MANVTIANSDSRQADETPRVSIAIESDRASSVEALAAGERRTRRNASGIAKGIEYLFVKEYSIDQDVLSLGDPFRVVLPNIDGALAGRIMPGDLCRLYMESPHVDNVGKVQKAIGRVVTIDGSIDAQSGSILSIGGQDLGWHLQECHADIFRSIPGGITFDTLVERLIGSARLAEWKFAGVEFNNLENRKINQGRAGVERQIARDESTGKAFVPPLQVEPGQAAAEFLIEFARRAKRLVNVSSDGYLQFFEPNDQGAAEYELRLYKSTNPNRNRGNVKTARATWNLDGIYTRTVCVGTVVFSKKFVQNDAEHPNRTRFRGQFDERDLGPIQASALPFPRTFYFADGDQLTKDMANKRAQWKLRRGRFDSFSAQYTVAGHTQNGKYWAPDTCVDLDDEIHGLKGKYYISAVRYDRTMQAGTTTTITVHESGLLSA